MEEVHRQDEVEVEEEEDQAPAAQAEEDEAARQISAPSKRFSPKLACSIFTLLHHLVLESEGVTPRQRGARECEGALLGARVVSLAGQLQGQAAGAPVTSVFCQSPLLPVERIALWLSFGASEAVSGSGLRLLLGSSIGLPLAVRNT